MTEPIRISPEMAWGKITSGSGLLVCAYDDDQKFQNNHLQGALSYAEFQSKLSSISKDQEIIFYCAWPNEASAAGLAEKYLNDGYTNLTVLGGGVEGWKNAGYAMAD